MAIQVLSQMVRPGAPGPTGLVAQIFVQPTQPAFTGQPYVWIQTGLGSTGQDWTIWYNDGVPS